MNENHELDLKLIQKYGFPEQERDLAVEEWDALPVEESLRRLKKSAPIVSEIMSNLLPIPEEFLKKK